MEVQLNKYFQIQEHASQHYIQGACGEPNNQYSCFCHSCIHSTRSSKPFTYWVLCSTLDSQKTKPALSSWALLIQ